MPRPPYTSIKASSSSTRLPVPMAVPVVPLAGMQMGSRASTSKPSKPYPPKYAGNAVQSFCSPDAVPKATRAKAGAKGGSIVQSLGESLEMGGSLECLNQSLDC